MPKWTPGPWFPGHMTDPSHSCVCRSILCEAYLGSIATVSQNNGLQVSDGGNDSPPEAEAIANAHLIAAAPELAAAIKAGFDQLAKRACCEEDQIVLRQMHAALKKAMGEGRE